MSHSDSSSEEDISHFQAAVIDERDLANLTGKSGKVQQEVLAILLGSTYT